jgi:hypothetical protein
MVDPAYARKNSPTGELLQHPVVVTTIAFYSLGEKGIGTWIRTPGARYPQQRIEIIEPFRYGEIITTTATTTDKFTQRDKPYLQMLLEFHNERDALKARWWCSLILTMCFARSSIAVMTTARMVPILGGEIARRSSHWRFSRAETLSAILFQARQRCASMPTPE